MKWTTKEKLGHMYLNGVPCALIPIPNNLYPGVKDFINTADKPEYEITVEPPKKKRSLDSNSYLWVLCDKIAKVIKSTKEDVYRIAIRDVGEWEDKPIPAEDVEKHIKLWGMIGEGWFSEELRDSKLKGHKVVRDYYGSHVYDTVSMSRLIDYIVEEAKEIGIETMTPREISELKSKWGDAVCKDG